MSGTEAPLASADILKDGVPAARLTKWRDRIEFSYREEYVKSGGRAIATSLPLGPSAVVVRGGGVPAFFAGLLPEGRRLSAVRRALKTSADDEFSLLLAVGGDTVGDVQVFHADEPAAAPEPELALPDDLSTISLRDALTRSPFDPIAIPGVQDKVSGRMINLPGVRRGERLIVKLDPPEYPHVVRNEAAMLALASACGLETPRWRLATDAEGLDALLITRFDRSTRDGVPTRLPCEDAAQVLGLWPADKYLPGYDQVIAALAAQCSARLVAIRALFTQLVFVIVSGNGDAHAKNFSLLGDSSGEWRVSPAYDLVSTAAYGDRTLALPLGGDRAGISRRKLLAFAARLGLPDPVATRVLDTILARTAPALTAVSDLELGYDPATTRAWQKHLDHQRRLLAAE